MIDLEPAATEVAKLLDGVTDADLAAPTPCPDFSVAALLDHLMGLTLAFTWAARKSGPETDGPTTGSPGIADGAHLAPDWRTVLPRRLDDLVAAWREPSAWQGETEAGGVRMPAEVTGVVALDELVMHGWDLARATGQPFRCDPASTEAVLGFTTEVARDDAPKEGLFGPPVPVPADAPALDRALGFAGRDPAWQPPGGPSSR